MSIRATDRDDALETLGCIIFLAAALICASGFWIGVYLAWRLV